MVEQWPVIGIKIPYRRLVNLYHSYWWCNNRNILTLNKLCVTLSRRGFSTYKCITPIKTRFRRYHGEGLPSAPLCSNVRRYTTETLTIRLKTANYLSINRKNDFSAEDIANSPKYVLVNLQISTDKEVHVCVSNFESNQTCNNLHYQLSKATLD